MDEEISQSKGGKLNNLENLSKEELVSKYKNLLVLLKKAKASKDECSAELEKEKTSKAKLIKSFEDEKNATERERDALSDMVSDLSDNKLNLVTKTESLQRQLQLQLSEVENLKSVENSLILSLKSHELEIEKLKKFIEKQQEDFEEMKVERNKHRLQSKTWDGEKFQLMDTVQSLKEQVAQTKLLKERLNTLVEENSELKQDLEKESKEKQELKSRVEAAENEKKALHIIQNNLNMEKKNLHENLELAKIRIEKLTGNLNLKNISETENELDHCKEKLDQAEVDRLNVDDSYKKLLAQVESYKEDISSLTFLNEKLESKLQNFSEQASQSFQYQKEVVNTINPMNEFELNAAHNVSCHENTEKDHMESNLHDKLNEMGQKIVDLKSENDRLNSVVKKFEKEELKWKDLNTNLCSENLKLKEYKEYIDKVQIKAKEENFSLMEHTKDLETLSNVKNLENELLKQETHNIIGLVSNLLFINVKLDSGDITEDLKNFCASLQKLLNYFDDSNLEQFCNNLSTNINTLSEHIMTMLDSESELTSDCMVVEPIFSLLCNLKEICLILSKFFKLNIAPDLITNIDSVKMQINAWGKFVKNTYNEKLNCQEEIKKLLIKIKEFKDYEETINENLSALKGECENYKDALCQENKLKLLQENSIECLNKVNEELRTELENQEHQVLLLSKKLESTNSEKEALCIEASSGKVELDAKLRESSNRILEMEKELSQFQKCVCELNEKAGISEINHRNELEDLQKYLSSKQYELSNLEESKVKIEEEMNSTAENLKSVSEELMEIKVGYALLEGDNKKTKDLVENLKSELVKVELEKCKLEEELLNSSKLLDSKQIYESQIQDVMTENDNLKLNILTLESNLQELKKKLDESYLLQAAIEKEKVDIRNETGNRILELEDELTCVQNSVCELNEKAAIIDINHKNELEDLKNLLSSKQFEFRNLEESKGKIEEEMNSSIENLKSVSEELMEIKESYALFEDDNKKTKDLVENLKSKLVKVELEKCKLEEELLNSSKLLDSKQIYESQIQEVATENDNLKLNILALESNLQELKKKLDESYLLQAAIEKEKVDIRNETLELTREKLLVEENVEAQRIDILTLKEETSVLMSKNISLEKDVRQFEGSCKSLSEKIHNLTVELDALKIENNNLTSSLATATDKLSHSVCLVEELETKLVNRDSKIVELDELCKAIQVENVCYLEECNKLNKLNEGLNEKLSYIENEMETLSKSYDETHFKCETLTNENLNLKSCDTSSYNEKLQELTIQNSILIQQLNLSNADAKESKNDNSSSKLKLSSLEPLIEEGKTQINLTGQIMEANQGLLGETSITSEPSESSAQRNEILADLNHMNELLRERGEKISRLEDIIREKNREISVINSQLEEANKEMSNREEEIVSKQEELKKLQIILPPPPELSNLVVELETKIVSLEKEKEQLQKMALNSSEYDGSAKVSHYANIVSVDCQSEIMSTSTISKAEDIHRMKELEDSFEERYMKLKSVALKLKKKLAEQSAEMKALEDSKRKLIIEREELLKKSNGTASRNIQVLQAEIDRLQDTVDINSKELKQRDKQLFSSAQEISDLKLKLVSVEDENECHSKEILKLKELLAVQENTCQSLLSQVASLEIRLKSEELKRIQLEEQEKNAEHRYKEISIQLEEVRQEYKKNSLMDLEMKDYEKTFEELTNQVVEKDSSILQLEQQLTNETNKGKNLIDQIQFLQSQVESETERAEKLKKTVMEYKVQLENLHQIQEVQLVEKEKDSQNIEFLNQELEKLKIAMAELSAETSKSENMLRLAKETTEQHVEDLEKNLALYEKKNSELQEELQSLKAEFDGYKIRAQSVLRKKSTFPEENQEQTKAEREQLNEQLEASHIKCHQLQSELAAVRADLVFMSSEKDRLSKQTMKMTEEMHKSEAESHEKLMILEKKLEGKTKEYQRIIANMSNQSEDMQKNFNAQEESQKEAYLQELQKLQCKLEEAEEKIWQLKNCPSTSLGMSSGKANGRNEMEIKKSPLAFVQHHMRKHSEGTVYGNEEPLKVDVSNMIREDGEGSEWVEPSQHRSPSHPRYSPPPLEQLINNPFPPQQSLDESASIVSAATDFSAKEIAKLESKVSSCENRIIQLTNLLADSEAENEKLVQLSDMLKEEIRRGSRNESREKHLENNEYMKNVVLKFLSLKTGDEKFRLIPVLKTILQLSPEEAKQLAIIAKGDDGSGSGSQAWSNYLHLWSGR